MNTYNPLKKHDWLDPSSSSYRRPPSNWREILINLARERGGELEGLADELESQP